MVDEDIARAYANIDALKKRDEMARALTGDARKAYVAERMKDCFPYYHPEDFKAGQNPQEYADNMVHAWSSGEDYEELRLTFEWFLTELSGTWG